jgi:hypothetical protein
MIRRIRFSIIGLLVLTLILALAASNVVSYRRLREVEPALEKLRNEVGELTVSDPRLVHAITIPSFEDSTYRWRLHLPGGRNFTLHAAAGQIPEDGLPEGGSANTLVSHTYAPRTGDTEILQTVAVNRNQQRRWQLTIDDGNSSSTAPLPENLKPWLERASGRTWNVAGREKTVSEPKGKPLHLFRLRKAKELPGGAVTVDMQPTDGILVWIEEDPR